MAADLHCARTSREKYQQDEREDEDQHEAEEDAQPEAALVIGVGVGSMSCHYRLLQTLVL